MKTETETKTEINETCENCGAEIRSGSQFCYGCGKQVGEDENPHEDTNVVEFPKPKRSAESPELSEDFLVPEEAPVEEPIPRPEKEKAASASVDPVSAEPVELPKDRKRRRNERMETAASIKQRERLRVKTPTEIVWDRPETSWVFAAASVVILLIVAVIFYFAVMGK